MTVTNTSYTTVALVRDFLGVEDSADDAAITAAIAATTLAIDRYCGQFFSNDDAATARSFHAARSRVLRVPPFHTTTGLVVATDTGDNGTFDSTWTVTTDYVAEPPGGYDSAGLAVSYNAISACGARYFPVDETRPRVQVTARWGWAAIPTPVAEAALIKTARLVKRSEAPFGTLGSNDFGMVRISRWEDPDVAMLLADYVRYTHRPVVA